MKTKVFNLSTQEEREYKLVPVQAVIQANIDDGVTTQTPAMINEGEHCVFLGDWGAFREERENWTDVN